MRVFSRAIVYITSSYTHHNHSLPHNTVFSRSQERLVSHIQAHPEFIQPELRRNEILARLQEPLQDLSISRTTFAWGGWPCTRVVFRAVCGRARCYLA
jgi:hypothetical protein